FLADTIGVIPVTETLLSSFNLFIVITLLITLPILNKMLMKSRDVLGSVDLNVLHDLETETDETPTASTEITTEDLTPAERLENSKIVSLLIGILGLIFIIYHFMQNGLDLNINIVNFIVLFLGIIFHQTPRRFLDSVTSAVKNASGIIVQFPFYAGIM